MTAPQTNYQSFGCWKPDRQIIFDKIDGLAAGTSAIIGTTLGILAYVSGNTVFADYLNIMYIPNTGELVVFMAASEGIARRAGGGESGGGDWCGGGKYARGGVCDGRGGMYHGGHFAIKTIAHRPGA